MKPKIWGEKENRRRRAICFSFAHRNMPRRGPIQWAKEKRWQQLKTKSHPSLVYFPQCNSRVYGNDVFFKGVLFTAKRSNMAVVSFFHERFTCALPVAYAFFAPSSRRNKGEFPKKNTCRTTNNFAASTMQSANRFFEQSAINGMKTRSNTSISAIPSSGQRRNSPPLRLRKGKAY